MKIASVREGLLGVRIVTFQHSNAQWLGLLARCDITSGGARGHLKGGGYSDPQWRGGLSIRATTNTPKERDGRVPGHSTKKQPDSKGRGVNM